MVALRYDDWAEIFYALETKQVALRQGTYGTEVDIGQDARWITHLQAIKRKIGSDGDLAAQQGTNSSKSPSRGAMAKPRRA